MSVSTTILAVVAHGVTLFFVPPRVAALVKAVFSFALLNVFESYSTCHPDVYAVWATQNLLCSAAAVASEPKSL